VKKIIIAIDGHSSCGKSTLAKSLGDVLHYNYISTGDMYRAVTLYLIENQIDVTDERAVKIALPNIEIHFENRGNGTHIFLNGKDVQGEIRKMYVSEKVSPVATISAVRRKMVFLQHGMGDEKGIVMDGRDIGTVVFPKAALKIFLTADVEERTRRRFEEIKAKGQHADWEEVKQNLMNRDHIDSTREDSPLKQADDAVLIDNTNLSPTEQLAMVKVLAECRMQG
jgi:cytidylate kinase